MEVILSGCAYLARVAIALPIARQESLPFMAEKILLIHLRRQSCLREKFARACWRIKEDLRPVKRPAILPVPSPS